MYMLLPVLPFGPSDTCPAGKVFVKTSNVRGVPSLLRIEVPVSVQVESIQDRRPIRESTATATVAEVLTVKRTSGLAVDPLLSLAVRIHCWPVSAAGTVVQVNVRSPYWTLPACRLVCSDQSAALAESPTVRPVMVRPPEVPTLIVALAVCVAVPAVPVMVTVKLPEASLGTGTVSTEEPPAGTGLVLNDGVEPAGAPDAVSPMSPGVPLTTAVDTLMVAVPPGLTVWLAGAALSEKSLPPLGQDWVEPVALIRRAPPAVLVLFRTQYGLMLRNSMSFAPVLRSALKPSNVTVLPPSAITAGRASALPKST